MQTATPGPAHEKHSDNFTKDGAERLAGRIQAFWAARGLFPKVWVEFEFLGQWIAAGTQGGVYVVKSDMVGGMPRPC